MTSFQELLGTLTEFRKRCTTLRPIRRTIWYFMEYQTRTTKRSLSYWLKLKTWSETKWKSGGTLSSPPPPGCLQASIAPKSLFWVSLNMHHLESQKSFRDNLSLTLMWVKLYSDLTMTWLSPDLTWTRAQQKTSFDIIEFLFPVDRLPKRGGFFSIGKNFLPCVILLCCFQFPGQYYLRSRGF